MSAQANNPSAPRATNAAPSGISAPKAPTQKAEDNWQKADPEVCSRAVWVGGGLLEQMDEQTRRQVMQSVHANRRAAQRIAERRANPHPTTTTAQRVAPAPFTIADLLLKEYTSTPEGRAILERRLPAYVRVQVHENMRVVRDRVDRQQGRTGVRTYKDERSSGFAIAKKVTSTTKRLGASTEVRAAGIVLLNSRTWSVGLPERMQDMLKSGPLVGAVEVEAATRLLAPSPGVEGA